MLNVSIYIVFAILLIVCCLLLLLVLMQRPKQEGLGAAFGTAMTDQAFGARTTDVLKKGTAFFGTCFMVLCFVLAMLMTAANKNRTSDLGNEPSKASAPAKPQDAVGIEKPTAPAPAEQPAPAPAAEPAPAPATEQPAA
ncbi:MAG: preprotein translocase subunit SecG [Akkermansia sp.]|nr:preprotein translocase subunit SecG [Akkermansia sp.]